VINSHGWFLDALNLLIGIPFDFIFGEPIKRFIQRFWNKLEEGWYRKALVIEELDCVQSRHSLLNYQSNQKET